MSSNWVLPLIVFSNFALLLSAIQLSQPKAASSAGTLKVKNELQEKAQALYGNDALAITFVNDKGFRDMTSAGDVETGVVFKEAQDKSEIFLDKNPCKGKMISFHKPYSKQNAGTVKCGDKEIPTVTVTQK